MYFLKLAKRKYISLFGGDTSSKENYKNDHQIRRRLPLISPFQIKFKLVLAAKEILHALLIYM